MLNHPLHALFYPQTIAVVGASDRYGSTGRAVFNYLMTLENNNMMMIPINPSHKLIGGQKCYETLADASAEREIDLGIVILSAEKISGIVREAAKAKINKLIIINELDQISSSIHHKLERASEQAKKLGIQLLAVPYTGLSGLFQSHDAPSCAYIGQSRGIADCMKIYAQERGITFSRFLTLNPQNYSVSTGQLIDFIASENKTTALLVHVNILDNTRELISALTAAARSRPVVVLSTLTDPNEEVLFNQALERNHILSVQTLTQFFTATKLIHTHIISRGKKLLLISNSPQIGALSLKTLNHLDLELATPTAQTTRNMAKILPYKLHSFNPLYLPPDTAPSIFQAACEWALQDEHTDAVCLMYTGLNNTQDNHHVADMVSALQKRFRKPLLLAWLGSADTEPIRQLFNQRQNLHFRQPEHALHALSQLNYYRQHQHQRHRTSAFHDYRYAAQAASELRKYLRPLLPMAVLPTTKNNNALFLSALQADNQTHQNQAKNAPTQLIVQWQKREPFGMVLNLMSPQKTLALLPPLNPEIVANSLNKLGLPAIIWQDWLLNLADILTRVPEIHDTQLDVFHDVSKGIACRELKLNLQDPEHFSGNLNVYTPYPVECEKNLILPNGQNAQLRPIRPEDASLIQRFFAEQSETSRYNRFLNKNSTLSPALLSHLSRPDYQRELALIIHDEELNPLATASYTSDRNSLSCEFGISIADNLQGQGLGKILMNELISHAKERGFQQMRAEILANNHPMQKLALKLGFVLAQNPQDNSMIQAFLDLT